MELIRDKGTTAQAAEEAETIMYRALTKGLNLTLSMGNIISLAPPLIISKDEMDQALSIIEECVAEAETLGPGAKALRQATHSAERRRYRLALFVGECSEYQWSPDKERGSRRP